ncbi:unnamed protein product, partial [Cyprideis torosa]
MLRQYATNHREKLKLPSGSAAPAHSQKKKKQNWEYAADIQFLLPHLGQHRHMSGNLSTASKASEDEDLLRYAMVENDIPDSVEPTTPSSRDIEPNTPSSQDIEPNTPSSQDIQPTRRPKKKKNDGGQEAFLEKYCDAMVTITRGREEEHTCLSESTYATTTRCTVQLCGGGSEAPRSSGKLGCRLEGRESGSESDRERRTTATEVVDNDPLPSRITARAMTHDESDAQNHYEKATERGSLAKLYIEICDLRQRGEGGEWFQEEEGLDTTTNIRMKWIPILMKIGSSKPSVIMKAMEEIPAVKALASSKQCSLEQIRMRFVSQSTSAQSYMRPIVPAPNRTRAQSYLRPIVIAPNSLAPNGPAPNSPAPNCPAPNYPAPNCPTTVIAVV